MIREMLTFHRAATEFGSMLRCSMGVIVAFLFAWWTGHFTAGPIMAIGAFICGFISLEGIYRSRVKLILATAIGIAASSFIGEMALGSLPLLVALTAVVGYLSGVFAQVSRLAGAVALYTSVTFIVFSHQPLSVEASLVQSGLLLCGSAIQIVLLMVFYPLSSFNAERKALAAAFMELSNFADTATGEYQKAPPTLKYITANQVLADPQPFARSRDIARFKRLLHDIHVLRNRFAGIHALQNFLSPEQATAQMELLLACTQQLQTIAFMLAGSFREEQLLSADAEIRRTFWAFEAAFAHDNVALSIVNSTIMHLRDAVQGASLIATGKFSRFLFVASPRPGQYVEIRLNWRSGEALRLAIVLSIAMLLGHTVFALGRGYWVALTAVLVLKPDLRSTFVRGFSRIGGTMLGALAATLLMALHPNWIMLEIGMVFFGAICYSTFLANYAIFTVAVTIFVIFFLTLIGLPSDASIGSRVFDTIVGGVLAMAGYIALPTWAHRRTREVLADLMETQAAFADTLLLAYEHPETFQHETLERLRIRAWKLRIDAEALVDRARTEPEQAHAISAERALDMLAATQSFALVNLAMESGLDASPKTEMLAQFDEFRAALASEMRILVNAVRSGESVELALESKLEPAYAVTEQHIENETALHRFLRIHCTGYRQSAATLRGICGQIAAKLATG